MLVVGICRVVTMQMIDWKWIMIVRRRLQNSGSCSVKYLRTTYNSAVLKHDITIVYSTIIPAATNQPSTTTYQPAVNHPPNTTQLTNPTPFPIAHTPNPDSPIQTSIGGKQTIEPDTFQQLLYEGTMTT